jgi:hypothetical protein
MTAADGNGEWLIALADSEEQAAVSAGVLAIGQRTMGVRPVLDVPADVAGVVVDAGHCDGSLAQALRGLRWQVAAPILVVHDAGDAGASWAAMRYGCTPWGRPAAAGSLARVDSLTIVDQLRQAAARQAHGPLAIERAVHEALAHLLDGRVHDASAALSRIPRSGNDHALQELTRSAATTLQRLRRRSQYPIPLRYVIDRLTVLHEGDVDLCTGFLYEACFWNAGVEVPGDQFFPDHLPEERRYGAIVALEALVRYTAARWWTSPSSVLDGLGSDERAELEAAS